MLLTKARFLSITTVLVLFDALNRVAGIHKSFFQDQAVNSRPVAF